MNKKDNNREITVDSGGLAWYKTQVVDVKVKLVSHNQSERRNTRKNIEQSENMVN